MGLVIVIAMTSCMAELPIRPREQCSIQGMVLGGASMKLGDDDPELHCRRPETPAENCEALAAQKSLDARRDYGTGGRNLGLFIGYVAFILPGVLLHIAFNSERDDIGTADDELFASELNKCAAPTEHLGPPGR